MNDLGNLAGIAVQAESDAPEPPLTPSAAFKPELDIDLSWQLDNGASAPPSDHSGKLNEVVCFGAVCDPSSSIL